jgi:predicted transcriptional regulator
MADDSTMRGHGVSLIGHNENYANKSIPSMTESRNRATDAEIQLRRVQVLRLRFAELSETEIAERLGVSPSTVSRDLEATQDQCSERFRSSFDVGRELAEAVALFEVLEGAAVRELVRLEPEVVGGAAAKVKCIHAAGAMRSRRVELLAAVGLMAANNVRPRNELPSAAEIRLAIESARSNQLPCYGVADPGW